MASRSSRVRKAASPDPWDDSTVSALHAVPARSKRGQNKQPGLLVRTEDPLMKSPAYSNIVLAANSRKRKRVDPSLKQTSEMDASPGARDSVATAHFPSTAKTKEKKVAPTNPRGAPTPKDKEKRLRMHRKKAPLSYLEKLSRAQTQRMIVVGRTRGESDGIPNEEIDLVGSTGNVYRVTIDRLPSCTCPDHQKGNECKHKIYVMVNVLKAPEHLQYQLAYLSSELEEIFAQAPPVPSQVSSSDDTDGMRKPTEGECPICYMDLDEEQNELVWCRAACGNNMHKGCFDQWAASQRGVTVKCVYCRTPWKVDPGDLQAITQAGVTNEEGYVNVAERFGMSGARDYSTYHPYWVRRQLGRRY